MRNDVVIPKLALDQIITCFNEAESMVFLLQKWSGGNDDQTLQYGLRVLEGCLNDLYRDLVRYVEVDDE
ncbi:hypothetical protein [Pasteurella multocida]|uniref:hypothetical protein n=1 Tax=Pasteurella multocida TaxID=747 RepID=UPI00244799F6|nr:hypothetical protein [Pasteurella multocida]MDH3002648.1 hypothetical protein [Pasteurella multocida]